MLLFNGVLLIMGTVLPPNEPGSTCPLCFGVGKPHSGVTPKYITLDVSGILPGQGFAALVGGLGNGSHILKQVAACAWRLTDLNTQYLLTWSSFQSRVTIRDRSTLIIFISPLLPEPCLINFSNIFMQFTGNIAYSGSVDVNWIL